MKRVYKSVETQAVGDGWGVTLDGRPLWTLGTLNQPSDTGYSPEGRANLLSIKRGSGPFNRPTRLAVARRRGVQASGSP